MSIVYSVILYNIKKNKVLLHACSDYLFIINHPKTQWLKTIIIYLLPIPNWYFGQELFLNADSFSAVYRAWLCSRTLGI